MTETDHGWLMLVTSSLVERAAATTKNNWIVTVAVPSSMATFGSARRCCSFVVGRKRKDKSMPHIEEQQSTTQVCKRSHAHGSLKIANTYGNFDLAHEKLPRGYVHVKGRVHATARRLRIKYVPAVVDFRTSKYGASPVTDGIVCTARSARKLDAALQPKREQARQLRSTRELANLCEAISSASSAALKHPTPNSALPEACETLFALNRHAKSSAFYRREIYGAKNKLIRKLVIDGHLAAAGEHSINLDAQECFSCDGDGCDRCTHTGLWQRSATRRYHVLRFVIAGKSYTWHQPIELVDFTLPSVPRLDDAGDWDPREPKLVPAIDHIGRAIALVLYAAQMAR